MNVGSTLSTPFGEATHRPRGAVSPDIFAEWGRRSADRVLSCRCSTPRNSTRHFLNPISLQIFHYYLEQGFPPEVLFDLFARRSMLLGSRIRSGGWHIDCTRRISNASNASGSPDASTAATQCLDITYFNSVSNDFDFDQFQVILLHFAEGLSTEHVETTFAFGPPIPAKTLQPTSSGGDGSQAAAIIQAYASAAQAGLKITPARGQDGFQLESVSDCSASATLPQFPRPRCCFAAVRETARDRWSGGQPPGGQPTPGEVSDSGITGFNLHRCPKAQETLINRLQQATLRRAGNERSLTSMHVTSFQLLASDRRHHLLPRRDNADLYPEQGKFPRKERALIMRRPTQVPDGAMPERPVELGVPVGGYRKPTWSFRGYERSGRSGPQGIVLLLRRHLCGRQRSRQFVHFGGL